VTTFHAGHYEIQVLTIKINEFRVEKNVKANLNIFSWKNLELCVFRRLATFKNLTIGGPQLH
jgi:hypothetical protein